MSNRGLRGLEPPRRQRDGVRERAACGEQVLPLAPEGRAGVGVPLALAEERLEELAREQRVFGVHVRRVPRRVQGLQVLRWRSSRTGTCAEHAQRTAMLVTRSL